MIQKLEELEKFYENYDPWGYETNKDDEYRKKILLSYLEKNTFKNILDIGCGEGFITRDLPGEKIVGIDISNNAIKIAKQKNNKKSIDYHNISLFELLNYFNQKFDLIIITGVLYPQYIGDSRNLVYMIIDSLLEKNGLLISVHISEWNFVKFPYLIIHNETYKYRSFTHIMEVYKK